MSDDKKVYRTVIGIVQFPPREGEAGGKAVRNVRIREVGFKEQSVPVSLTLWPSHAHIEVNEGDVLIAEGTYKANRRTNEETGETVTYHNVSVSKLRNLGGADTGRDEDDDSAPAAADDDDIPF